VGRAPRSASTSTLALLDRQNRFLDLRGPPERPPSSETEVIPRPRIPRPHHLPRPRPSAQQFDGPRPGHAYIFFNYGAHFMLNVVSEPAGNRSGIPDPRTRAPRWHQAHAAPPQDQPASQSHERPGRLAAAFPNRSPPRRLDLCAPGPLWLGKTGRPTGPIGETSASAFRAPRQILVFTSAGIPSLVDPSGSFARRGPQEISLSDQSGSAVEIDSRSRVQHSSRFFFRALVARPISCSECSRAFREFPLGAQD